MLGKMWNFLIVLLAVLFYCYKSPFFQKVDPISYSISLPEKLDGPLTVNNDLDKTERLHENELHWPEAFAVHKGEMYSGLGDGRIVRISPKKIIDVCRIGKDCEGQHEEHICGRPLGLTFNKAGQLFVADAYHGLFSVDVKTGKKINLLPSTTVVEGLPITFLNALTFDEKEENIYMTQSSTRWNLSMVLVSIIEHDSSGRLLKYNLKTKQLTVILKGLRFPNGLELTHDGTALLVAEGNTNTILKYYLKGEKIGKHEDLPMKLPGRPDNIQRNSRGTYWVALAGADSAESPSLLDKFSDKPFWRKFFLHLHKLSTAPITSIMGVLPYKKVKEIGFELQTTRIISDYIIHTGQIVEFNDDGKILRSLHSTNGKVTHLSDVMEIGGSLYLGSWRNHYVGKLKL